MEKDKHLGLRIGSDTLNSNPSLTHDFIYLQFLNSLLANTLNTTIDYLLTEQLKNLYIL